MIGMRHLVQSIPVYDQFLPVIVSRELDNTVGVGMGTYPDGQLSSEM